MVDINCDMGEGIGNEAALMPYIHSANIACGYHAGDIAVMQNTIELCCQHNVWIGAHPSFPDKEYFGRKEMKLTPQEIYELVTQQLIILQEVADPFEKKLHHVKPHGALYNMSARDTGIANAIAKAVKDFDAGLILYGLSGATNIGTITAVTRRLGSRSPIVEVEPNASLTQLNFVSVVLFVPNQAAI